MAWKNRLTRHSLQRQTITIQQEMTLAHWGRIQHSSIFSFSSSYPHLKFTESNDLRLLSLSTENCGPELKVSLFDQYDNMKRDQRPSMCHTTSENRAVKIQFQPKKKNPVTPDSESGPCDEDHEVHLSCGGPEILDPVGNRNPLREIQEVVNCEPGKYSKERTKDIHQTSFGHQTNKPRISSQNTSSRDFFRRR